MVNELSRLGFSVSTNEVIQHKQSVMENEYASELISMYFPRSADNVDHNIRTLDGKDTIHAMEIVCPTTSMHHSLRYEKMRPIQRQKTN